MLLATDKGSLALIKKNNLSPAEYKESARLKGFTGDNLFHLSFVDKHFIQALLLTERFTWLMMRLMP